MNSFLKTAIATTIFAVALPTYAVKTQVAPTGLSNAEQSKIEKVVQNYILEHPEVVIQAVQNFQRKQYEEAAQTVEQTQKNAPTFAASLFNQTGDPVAGNPNGKINIVEFFDYQCPHCMDMAPVIQEVIKKNPNVRIVFKEFPIKGPLSDLAARAALAANLQGKYYEFSHALLTANKPLSEAFIFETAKAQGLDVDKLKKDMNTDDITKQLKENMKLAKDLKLFGTPAFFVGKGDDHNFKNISYVPGQMNQTQIQEVIEKTNK